MSEEFAPVTDMEPVGSPEVSSEVTGTEPDAPVLSVEDYSNHKVAVKLDGEELYVPLNEAIAGYQRQADYTRKTQELAQQREQVTFASALQTALETDPAGTIDLLSRHYGISRQAAADMVSEMDDFEDLDPVEKRYRELDQRIASFEEAQAAAEVEKEISRLQGKYQDFEPNEVVTAALRAGTTDLEAVYKQIAFDKIMSRQEMERQARERLSAQDQQVIDAKRQAAVVSGGSSASGSTVVQDSGPIRSVQDAWAAAKQQLNANF